MTNSEKTDTLKKKIQRLEWWPEEYPDDILRLARNYEISDSVLKDYISQFALDPDYVNARVFSKVEARDLFYRNEDVINDICSDWNEYRENNLGAHEKICFITCCNNDAEYDEMKAWIDRLWVPEDMEITFAKISGALSMCAGYNRAMQESDARFKVYLHQDVRILNPFFIFDCIDVFRRHPKAGMIGMMGAGNVPNAGVMWDAQRFGAVVHVEQNDDGSVSCYHEHVSCGKDVPVALADGFIMVTRVDLPWREDIFTGWHFYDASQSMEFLKSGYEIIIPDQKQSWCMHDYGRIGWDNYLDAREAFEKNYIQTEMYKKIRLSKPVLIVVVSYNSQNVMRANIESIRKYAPEGGYKIVVVDNASTDGVAQWLSQQKDIIFVGNQHNVGYGPACNQGVAATIGTEYEDSDVFVLNNDTRLTPGALENLKAALYSTDDTGAVGCVANKAGNKQQIDVTFENVEDYMVYGEKNNVPMDDPYLERVRLSGFAMMVRRNVWEETGGFNDAFVPGYFEDDDLSMQILLRGYRLKVVRNSFIYHIGTESFKNTDIDSYVLRNFELFKKKYGFDIIQYANASGNVISHIPYRPKDEFVLAHYGCGLGADLKAVRSLFPNSKVIGMEENPDLRNVASGTEIVYESLEDYHAKCPTDKIDVFVIEKETLDNMNDNDKNIIVNHLSDKPAVLYKGYVYDEYKTESIQEQPEVKNVSPEMECSLNEIPQKVVDIISKVRYKDAYIYRYILDELVLFESEEEVERNMEISSGRRSAIYTGDRDKAKEFVNSFFDELSLSDVLVGNIAGRKIVKGEEYLTVLDPYIDSINCLNYLVVDISGKTEEGEYPTHTQNVRFCPSDVIINAFGIEEIDYDDLKRFMDEKFFSEIELNTKRTLYTKQKDSLVNVVFYALSVRGAFMRFYQNVLSIVRPKVIVYSHGGNCRMAMLYETAQKMGIPCAEIAHGAEVYHVNYPETARHYDKLVVYSDILKNDSEKYGVENLIAIGRPGITEKGNNYNPVGGDAVIICVISSVEQGLFELAGKLSQELSPDKYAVLYKKHLVERLEDGKRIKNRYPNLTVIGGEVEINSLFEKCQIVIGHRSTALLEALVYDKIKIVLVGGKNDYSIAGIFSHFGHMIETGEMAYAGTDQDVINEIKAYRKGDSYRLEGELFWKKDAKDNFREYIASLL